MTALSIERKTPKLAQDVLPSFPTNLGVPVGAAVKIYEGAIVCQATQGSNAGYGVQGTTALGLIPLGVAEKTIDNSTGGLGALTVVPRQGVFLLNMGTGADVITNLSLGQLCYIIDDNTVGLTNGGGTRSPAGLVIAVDSGTPPYSQPTGVWVLVGVTTPLQMGALPIEYYAIADAAAGSATSELSIGRMATPANVSGVLYIPNVAVTANASNYATFTVGWRNGTGGALNTLGTLTTATTSPGAFQPTSFGAITNAAVPPGAVITYSVAKSGTGVQLPTGLVVVF